MATASDIPPKRRNLLRKSRELGLLFVLYVLAYGGMELLVDTRIRYYIFCVLLALSAIFFSWLRGGRRVMSYVTFFVCFFLFVFSKLLWAETGVVYADLFLSRSFLVIYVLTAGLAALVLLRRSPADAQRLERDQAMAMEQSARRNLEFMVASSKLKRDLLAQANLVKDELQLLEGAWRSSVHDIVNDLTPSRERELHAKILEPFQEKIVNHLRDLEDKLTFETADVCLEELRAFLLDQLSRHGRGLRVELDDAPWQGQTRLVRVDRNKLWDMLLNMLRNSQTALDFKRIEAMRAPGRPTSRFIPRLHLSLGLAESFAEIRLADNGGGVGETVLPRLYSEAVPSRKRGTDETGTPRPGQGTLFVKFFAERMDIDIAATNTTELGNKGLAVALRLPLQPTDAPAADVSSPPATKDTDHA